MNDTEQRIAIAEACGWTRLRSHPLSPWLSPHGGSWYDVPDYLNDLNAMHEAEKHLGLKYDKWTRELRVICLRDRRCIESATAAQRAEAFLRTLDLWKP